MGIMKANGFSVMLNRVEPDVRKKDQSLMYYLRSLFQWHDETLNCWTNIAAMLILGDMILGCVSNGKLDISSRSSSMDNEYNEWPLYIGCLSFTTNLSSFVAHLFMSKNYITECAVFAFDLFGAVIMGTVVAMSYVGYAFSLVQNQQNFISQHLPWVVFSIRVLGCVLYATSSSVYVIRCRREYRLCSEDLSKAQHVDVVECIAHCFPICALIVIPSAIYTGQFYPVVLCAFLLITTRLLLGASNRWSRHRWLLHSISHLTGALLVASELLSLARHTQQQHRAKLMNRAIMPYYLLADFLSIILLIVFTSILYFTVNKTSHQKTHLQ